MKNQLEIQDKIKNTYTKEMIIKKIAEVCGYSTSYVRKFYNTFEDMISELLSSANETTDVSLRLFEGITIDSTFVPQKTKTNNLTGEVIVTSSKIKPKANITRNYKEKLTAYGK